MVRENPLAKTGTSATDKPTQREVSGIAARLTTRTNLFVMATLHSAGGFEPVRIRDLSSDGAQVEGARLPAPGDQVRLCRADLQTSGEVVWCRQGRAGIQLLTEISVSDWLPAGKHKAAQQRVDRLVHQLKAPEGAARPAAVAQCPQFPEPLEVRQVTDAIQSLADDLANDSLVVERHWLKLQTLDVAVQFLGKIERLSMPGRSPR
jgi:hypothetical protein